MSAEGSVDENGGEEEGLTGDEKEEAAATAPVEKKTKKNKLDRLFARKNNDVLSTAFDKIRAHDDDEEEKGNDDSDADEFLTKKRPREQVAEDEFLTKKKARADEEEVEAKQMKAKR